jgi:signal transduction histidine kinase
MSTQTPQFNRLLLIDDEPAIRKIMGMDLRSDGYEVFTAEDGASGLELFQKEKPDLVMTDLKMPGMDGIEVLRRIKNMSPETEVIVITGHGDLELAIQALQLRASDFITKPINSAAMDVALMRAGERLAMTCELRSYTRDLEQKVCEATEKVLASERLAAVGSTVTGLVHSLKNICSGLRGGTYLVEQHKQTGDEDQLDTGLEMLTRNLLRVKGLVNDMLTVSKPRSPELSREDADALLAEAIECADQDAKGKGVELGADQSAGRIVLELDHKMILDALGNLISNAIDAAALVEKGRVRARVELCEDTVAFVVQDNGPGLDEEAKSNMFQAFYSSKGAEGTGMGLMVAQKIASEHGGRVEYSETKGQGTTFKLVLPLGPENHRTKK